jgi:hypothetical protein
MPMLSMSALRGKTDMAIPSSRCRHHSFGRSLYWPRAPVAVVSTTSKSWVKVPASVAGSLISSLSLRYAAITSRNACFWFALLLPESSGKTCSQIRDSVRDQLSALTSCLASWLRYCRRAGGLASWLRTVRNASSTRHACRSKDAAASRSETERPKPLSAPYPDECHVRFWHKTDMPAHPPNVCCRG